MVRLPLCVLTICRQDAGGEECLVLLGTAKYNVLDLRSRYESVCI